MKRPIRMPDSADTRTTFIDLFCGCGGFTLGMLRAGFDCLAAIDFNEVATVTLRENLEGARQVLNRDLTNFPPAELSALIGTRSLDVIVGGPPCQGFSTARQRDGSNHGSTRFKEDNRRHLYRHFLEYVEFFQPKVFVVENVLGLRSAAGGRYFTAVQHESRVLGRANGLPGYRVHAQIEDATTLGVPQKRRRQLIIGVRADLAGYFSPELKPAERAAVGVTLGDAICDLPPLTAGEGDNDAPYDFVRRRTFLMGSRQSFRRRYLFSVLEVNEADRLLNHSARPHSARDLRDFARIGEGQSSASLMREGVRFEFPYKKTTFKDRYTRQHRNRPCSTIVAHLSKDGLMFIHPTQNRSLTPREAARVQTFPDWFRLPSARTHSFRLVGNAVPPLVAEAVGCAILRFLSRSGPVSLEAGMPGAINSRTVTPDTTVHARDLLNRLMRVDRSELRKMPDTEFLLGWYALLELFPDLHPDNALNHGEEVLESETPTPEFRTRFVRTGWPVSLDLIGQEAWRRYKARRYSPDEFYRITDNTVLGSPSYPVHSCRLGTTTN